MTFTYDELLQALTAYETEAIELYPQKKKLIQMTVLSMQDFMKSKHTASFRDDQKQSSLPGLLQVPMSLVNGSIHPDIASENGDVLAGEWSTVRCLDIPKRSLPPIQEKLSFK